ncbi:MAG: protein kinase, partial [Anaerolineae bacterium]|nr:protein kinase [Anaerolineae bacterium]
MARIYKGYDEKLQRFAAVKVFDARAVPGDELEEYRQRFMREARAIARLRHTQIVDVYQTGQFEDYLYIAMMFIDGHDLRYVLKEHAADGTYMSPKEILRVVSDIATALDHAHREKVIHRDIKPSNIMIMDDGHAILTDFGLALSVPEGTTGTTFGSVHYIAPEQATSSALAVPQSDLYSLGVVLFEMLTGRVPFEDTSAMNVALKHITEKPPLLRAFRPEISPTVEAMVLRAIDKTPENRYQTGADFIQALEQAFGMTDVDEVTRQLEPLPAQALEAALEKLPDDLPLGTSATARPVIAKVDEKNHTDSVSTMLLTPPAGTQRNPLLIAGILVGIVALVGVLALGAAGVLEADITPT